MAHDIALNIDKDGMAEMACISGVMGRVPQQVEKISANRPIIVIDGCEQACTKSCLDLCSLTPEHYFNLESLGFELRDKWDESLVENFQALNLIYKELLATSYSFENGVKS